MTVMGVRRARAADVMQASALLTVHYHHGLGEVMIDEPLSNAPNGDCRG